MVARASIDSGSEQGFLGRALLSWRLYLTQLARGGRSAAETLETDVAQVASAARAGERPALRGKTLAVAAWVAIAAGGAAALLVAPAGTRVAAGAGVAVSIVWAAVRLWLLRFADVLPGDPKGTRGAWAAGMLAYAAAVVPELQFAAYVVSAAVTATVLTREGSPRGRALRAVAVAWGAQAVVMAAAWLARTAYVIAFFGG